jgi:integrase/recombinase XerD
VEGSLTGEQIRRSLETSDWTAATERVRSWEAQGFIREVSREKEITIAYAVSRFMADLCARNVSDASVRKFEVLLQQRLLEFSTQRGLTTLNQVTVDSMRDFRASWTISPAAPQNKQKDVVRPLGPLTTAKHLERLRQFFKFCVEAEWLVRNPATPVKAPKAESRVTLPFTEEELETILSEAQKNSRLNAMVLLLRFSGLRIGDAVTLRRDRVRNGRLLLYTAKSGEPVHLPLPPQAVDALNNCPSRNNEYYFWTGDGEPDTATNNWRDDITRLCRRAGVAGGRPHRFRDTLATDLLSKGVPVESVSVILGHSDIRITLKHYAPWVRARQDALDAAVRKSW